MRVRDNGRGGADFSHGSGLLGFKDRADAPGGHLQLHSPPAQGSTLETTLPLQDPGGTELPPGAADPTDDGGGLATDPGWRFDHLGAAQRTEPDLSPRACST